MLSQISIIGCGWLGMPLCKRLSQEGYAIKGSTTQASKLEEIRNSGAEPAILELGKQEDSLPSLLDSDIVLLNIPPSKIDGDYIEHLKRLAEVAEARKVSKIIFISSIGCYPLNGKVVREADAERIASKRSGFSWLEAEEVFTKSSAFETTVVRFAGLMGGAYKPGRFFRNRKVSSAQNPVNMIHQDDCVASVSRIISLGVWGETLNACADGHPSRKDFYTNAATEIGAEIPAFTNEEAPFRIVDSSRLKRVLQYDFIHPDPILALKA